MTTKIHLTLFLLIAVQAVVSRGSVTDEDLKKFAVANNHLASNLYLRIIEGHSRNVVFCPASLLTGLGMMLHGARGKTHEKLYSVLGYKAAGLPNYKIPSTYNHYFTQMLPENDPNTINYTLSCADEVLVKNGIELDPEYLADVQSMYQKVKNVDFNGEGSKVVDDINSFVKERTNGKINRFVESVRPDTSSFLVDAVYFRGNWEIPFTTGPFQTFYNGGSEEKKTTFLEVTGKFQYAKTDKLQVVEVPYIGDNVVFVVVLPVLQHGLSDVEQSLTSEKIKQIVNQLEPTNVLVRIPKFSLEYSRDFSSDLSALGAKSVFTGPADFSGMTSSKDLVISSVMHKAVFDVEESGQQSTKTRSIDASNPDATVNADHPFLFAVFDKRNGLFLFLGRIYNV